MKETIRQIIDSASDVADATEKLEAAARKDKALREYLTEPYLSRACYEAVRSEYRAERAVLWTAPNYTQGGNGNRVREHARSLLDFPLPNGKRLRDAKRADLLEAAEFYAKQAANMQSKADWLSRIAEIVGRRKVENALSEHDVAALREEFEAAA